MFNRRNFIKAVLLLPALPAIAKTTEPEFVFDDIGPRGVGQMTEKEYRAVKRTIQPFLAVDEKDIHWSIPGNRIHVKRVTVLNGHYLVTWKPSAVRGSKTIFIEVERTFAGEPQPFLTQWIDTILSDRTPWYS